MKVAFQGEKGAYSEAAAYAFLGEHVETMPCETFDDVFSQVSDHHCPLGIIPIENTLGGSIHRNYDLLSRHTLSVIAEKIFPVHHFLLAPKGQPRDAIQTVISHPQALAQCEHYLAKHKLKAVPWYDTAGAAKHIAESATHDMAAIASERAAVCYDLAILDQHIEDNPQNYTRFLLISPTPTKPKTAYVKTSMVFALSDRDKTAGSLYKALAIFAKRHINLTKIASRPNPSSGRFQYLFYIDFEGNQADENVRHALDELKKICSLFTVFGSYDGDPLWQENTTSGNASNT